MMSPYIYISYVEVISRPPHLNEKIIFPWIYNMDVHKYSAESPPPLGGAM